MSPPLQNADRSSYDIQTSRHLQYAEFSLPVVNSCPSWEHTQHHCNEDNESNVVLGRLGHCVVFFVYLKIVQVNREWESVIGK